ncbi:MAG: hypothetical protein EXQ91_08950 [Alphaproteobacteria bacterium]|nr:hypothetical protein [Alphaproteobacteria bacterium]
MPKVHKEKCKVVRDVDASERVVELDRIEGGRLAIDEANVAEMEIAVAAAYKTGPPTAFKHAAKAIDQR